MPARLRNTIQKLVPSIAVCAIVLAISCSPDRSHVTAPHPGVEPENVRGRGALLDEYIVVLDSRGPSLESALRVLKGTHSFETKRTFRHALRGFSARMTEQEALSMRREPGVRAVEPNRIADVFGSQPSAPWNLDRVDQLGLPLSGTYDYDQTGAGVDVYVIDTGVSPHPEFENRRDEGHGVPPEAGTLDNEGTDGHGTLVAGIIGAKTYGVAKQVRLIPVKAGSHPNGTLTELSIINAIDWVTWNRVMNRPGVPSVACLCVGLRGEFAGDTSFAMNEAVRNSIAAGITYCVAVGNEGHDALAWHSPCVAPAIMVGGSTNSSDGFYYNSNTGPEVDLLAPGALVTSTNNAGGVAIQAYGTSWSAPHAAGAAALYLEAKPGATPAMVQTALVAGAFPNQVHGVPDGTPNRFLNTRVIPKLTLVVKSIVPVAGKLKYTLEATASLGNTSYAYAWSNATVVSGTPTLATRVCLPTQHPTVTCTVTSGAETVVRSIVLGEVDGPVGPPIDQ